MAMFRGMASAMVALAVCHGAAAMQPGVNLSGLEWSPGTLPGTAGTDYSVPSDYDLKWFQQNGVRLIRLPIEWERVQNHLITVNPDGTCGPGNGGVLYQPYLQYVRGIVAEAGKLGMGVIVDVHNNGMYVRHWIGGSDGCVTDAMFADFWQRMAIRLMLLKGLAGYDLMNEPEGAENPHEWPNAAQAAVTAIRRVDTQTAIYVEGDNWASATTWQQVNANLSVTDPSNNIIYSAHAYGDYNSEGNVYSWAVNVANGVTVNTLAERIGNFTSWCQARQARCNIGEVGVGNDDPDWNVELQNGLNAAQAAGVESFTYWAAGDWWGSYPLSIEPDWNTTPPAAAPQFAVVSQYSSARKGRKPMAKALLAEGISIRP